MAHAREHLPSPLTRSAAIHPTTTTLSPSICLSLSHTTVDLQDDEEKGETIGEEKNVKPVSLLRGGSFINTLKTKGNSHCGFICRDFVWKEVVFGSGQYKQWLREVQVRYMRQFRCAYEGIV
jgi:hypothetical protein